MNNFDILIGTGKAILDRLHEQNQIYAMDDAEYIPVIKTIIKGIQDYAIKLNLQKEQISKIKSKLKCYARELYLKMWLEHGEEGENVVAAKAEGKENFDYIYKYEEHPY